MFSRFRPSTPQNTPDSSNQSDRIEAVSRSPVEISEIRVLGPRQSGKTTYMAALAYWPNASPDSPIESVAPFDDETTRLVDMAQDILENGLSLAGTLLPDDPEDLPVYTVIVEMKPGFSVRDNRFQVACRDYPGEIMQELRSGNTSSARLSAYLDDCADASGLLLLIDGNAKMQDKTYAQAFETLKTELNFRLSGRNRSLRDYRIAVAFSKAEQARVFGYRHDLTRFMALQFPKTRDSVQKWRKDWGCSVNFFFCSAFGMKGNPPRPNVKVEARHQGVISAVIDRPQFWRPFGLVAPLYWLNTGIDEPTLRQIKE